MSRNGRLHRVFVGYAAVLGLLFRLEVDRIYTSWSSLEELYGEHERLFGAIEYLAAREGRSRPAMSTSIGPGSG